MERLVYVRNTGKLSEENYGYELYYSEEPDNVWGVDWDIMPPVNCEDTIPEKTTISSTEKIYVRLRMKTAPEISCFSLEHCTLGILALSWIDLDGLEEYPEDGRCVLTFGMEKEKVRELTGPYVI